MSKKTVSMKGEEVDFDLLDIKAKMQKGDKPLEVKTREDFVHMKRRRRGSARFDDLLKKSSKPEEKAVTASKPTPTPKAEKVTQQPAVKEDAVDAATESPTAIRKVRNKRKIIKKDS